MGNTVLSIYRHRNMFVAGVFTTKGLYATSIPRGTREDAIRAVDGLNLPECNDIKHNEILKIVFEISEGSHQVDISQIKFDFTNLTPKQVAVLEATMKIPHGKTITYGKLATSVGLCGAARFVGNVMASNRFAPIIPCHRVVASNGLGGYSGGLDIKSDLLRREGVIAE